MLLENSVHRKTEKKEILVICLEVYYKIVWYGIISAFVRNEKSVGHIESRLNRRENSVAVVYP